MSGLTYDQLIISVTDNIDKNDKNRYFIALSGPPASGKSTISENLALISIQETKKCSLFMS